MSDSRPENDVMTPEVTVTTGRMDEAESGSAVRLHPVVSQPVRIQLSRKRGWKMPPNTVKVDRTTKWGNPFRVGQKNPYGTITKDVRHSYMLYVGFAPQNEKLVAAARAELSGKNLACWCRLGESCHADVLLKLANEKADRSGGQ